MYELNWVKVSKKRNLIGVRNVSLYIKLFDSELNEVGSVIDF